MQINLPAHKIVETDIPKIKDIPLAYINTDDSEYLVEATVDPNFCRQEKNPIRPYDEFEDSEPYMFDSDGVLINPIHLNRQGNRYIYLPDDATEFTPTQFRCNIMVERNLSFTTTVPLDMKAAAYEIDSDFSLAKKLLPIFGNAGARGICPPNITVNKGLTYPESMYYDTFADADFVFIESSDGIHFKELDKNEDQVVMQLDPILEQNTNIVLIVDDLENMLYNNSEIDEVTVSSPVVYNTGVYGDAAHMRRFYQDRTTEIFPAEEYSYSFWDSVLFLRKTGKGTIVVIPSEFIERIDDFAGMIYEAMVQVYNTSYFPIVTPYTWITDEPVDFSSYRKKRINAKHGEINLPRLLSGNGIRSIDGYNILSITCEPETVLFTGVTDGGDMLFTKAAAEKDPLKKDGETSYYTSKRTVIYCVDQELSTINQPFTVTGLIEPNAVYVQVAPCKSSTYKVYTDKTQKLKIPDIRDIYYLCTKPSAPPLTNFFELVAVSDYSEDNNGYIVATVYVKVVRQTSICDIRIKGGGLPSSMPDDYDMIDIGHTNGKPYRIGATTVITLPSKYESYRERLEESLRSHISAGEYPVLVFKDT